MDAQAQQLERSRRNEGPKRPPLYEIGKEGHFGSCQQLASQGQAPDPDIYTGPWTNINQGLHGTYREILSTYWQGSLRRLEDDDHDYKAQQLPIARIKKVMKADPEVKMISAEAPILFAKGCEIFITELTMRAWIHAEENKRRTLQRSDIAAALTKSDMFDFLIDIVPREEAGASHSRRPAAHSASALPPPPMPQQQPVPQQAPPPQHHPAPHEYAPYIPPEQEYRPSAMYPQVPADPAAYGHPQAPMFDQSMYAGYPMAPQQMYQMPPQRPQEPPVGPDPGHHYRPHESGGGDADAEGERDYDVD